MLFTKVVILLCFLHGWLKIRDRAKHLKEVFAKISRRVWDTYHVPTAGVLHNAWACSARPANMHRDRPGEGLDPGWKKDCWSMPYRHPAATAISTR